MLEHMVKDKMLTRIVRIGNSQGVRIPRLLLEQTGLAGEVEIEAQDGRIVIRKRDPPRQGWEESFKRMSEAGDDLPLDTDTLQTRWDQEEWEW